MSTRTNEIDVVAEVVRAAAVSGDLPRMRDATERLRQLLGLRECVAPYRVSRWRRTQQARLWTANGALSMTWGPGSEGQNVAFVSFTFPLGNGQGIDLANTSGATLSAAWRDMVPHIRRVQVLS